MIENPQCAYSNQDFALGFKAPPSQIPTNFLLSSFLSPAEMSNTGHRKGIFENRPNICFPIYWSFYAMLAPFFFNFLFRSLIFLTKI